ncbi:hypothetical protein SDC9_134566 [bioreactor metagenome]|uniref:Uncharacterized protein n=1 Tax=bioreactor metagenome TaxID=1076179 RepID=A0A645DDA2_9ZZZZ
MAHQNAEIRILRQLRHDGPRDGGRKTALFAVLRKADPVAEGHFDNALGGAARAHGPGGIYFSGPAQRMEPLPVGAVAVGVYRPVLSGFRLKEVDGTARLLEGRGEDVLRLFRRNGKGYQRGRHVPVQKRSGHGILSPDGCHAEAELRVQRAQQGRKGLAPAGGVVSQLFKILLKGEIRLVIVASRRHQLGKGLHHGGCRAFIAVFPAGAEHVAAPAHNGAVLGLLPGQNRQQRRHHLRGGALVLADKGHQDTARADGGVEPLGEAPL